MKSGKFRRKSISGSTGSFHRYTCFPWIKQRSSRPLFTMKTTLKCRFHIREHRVKIGDDLTVQFWVMHSEDQENNLSVLQTAVHCSWSCDFISGPNHLKFVPMCSSFREESIGIRNCKFGPVNWENLLENRDEIRWCSFGGLSPKLRVDFGTSSPKINHRKLGIVSLSISAQLGRNLGCISVVFAAETRSEMRSVHVTGWPGQPIAYTGETERHDRLSQVTLWRVRVNPARPDPNPYPFNTPLHPFLHHFFHIFQTYILLLSNPFISFNFTQS
jgi:hypothetical protein